ncbi:alpha/beta hydrolase [Streptomyces sp. NBC_01803]|uniref:alpha/beta hydrolase n=1 Tax=Streptomyces sp. NBC_01803 TaxID=2975946 RepID=UPI002DDBD4D0|nr:lysophospholipase [Streptomyces sp. NBC_01803]WSA46154.1 lysophospholipase [Streptomyces sp. NBC_01803]
MTDAREHTFTGAGGGEIVVREWPHERPRYVALLVHGYGEHIARYEHVADVLVRHGAAVYGPDHAGHGRSAGERVLIEDFERVVDDVRTVASRARADHPGVPVVVIGHSMGGMIATRYAQRYGQELAGLVLSGPVIGSWAALEALLALPEIPDIPIDPTALSRDPAVGTAYAGDPLVWHGPFKRPTLEALDRTLATIAAAGDLGKLPVLWMHGDADRVVPLAGSRCGIEAVRGTDLTERLYPGAEHEIFNETNKDEVLTDTTRFIDRVLSNAT